MCLLLTPDGNTPGVYVLTTDKRRAKGGRASLVFTEPRTPTGY